MGIQEAASIANIIVAIVAVAGIGFWIDGSLKYRKNLTFSERSIKEAERASRMQAIKYIFDIMERVRDQRHFLEEKIKGNPEFDVSNATDQEIQEFDRLARSYDLLGALVKHGIAPVEFVMDFYSRPVVKGWQYLEPMISAERRSRKQPGHMLKFQVFAAGAREYRRLVYPGELSFDAHQEIIAEWNAWIHKHSLDGLGS